ncbi:hypothetical protein [Haloarcula sp. Atlit-47R]|uniref:hypothetical protein n=1 Tax=Haloarcula sp. Atlit-47R TaxID=2282132 RepID=UPI0011C497CB|nr:hypothetical protein [Haloarcula sp. Atlit-47R]
MQSSPQAKNPELLEAISGREPARISAVFGVVFAAALPQPRLAAVGESVGGVVGFGLGCAAVLWIVAAGVVMPLWLSAVGFPSPPPLPNLGAMGLLTHLVFGLVLVVSYHYPR